MSTRIIISVLFVIFAIVFLGAFVLYKKISFIKNESFKKFLIASSITYLIGTIALMLCFIIIKELPNSFLIISEMLILSVHIITFFSIVFVGNNLDRIKEEARNKGESSHHYEE